jgi:hypothetical protein
MHGIELRSEERRTPRLSTPRPAVSPPAGSKLPGTPQPLNLSSLGPETRNGLSLAHNGFRLHGLHSGVNGPGLLLRFLRCTSPARSVFRSTAENGLPRFPAASSLGPVAEFLAALDLRSSGLHSPSGLLPPSGSKCSTGEITGRSTFRIRPISSRSPIPFLSLGSKPDQCSWFATFPEACCSSNLLEPSSLCAPRSFSSMTFASPKRSFPQLYAGLISVIYSTRALDSL